MDHAAHKTEMRNVCQIKNKNVKGNTSKVCLYMGRNCQKNMLLNFSVVWMRYVFFWSMMSCHVPKEQTAHY